MKTIIAIVFLSFMSVQCVAAEQSLTSRATVRTLEVVELGAAQLKIAASRLEVAARSKREELVLGNTPTTLASIKAFHKAEKALLEEYNKTSLEYLKARMKAAR